MKSLRSLIDWLPYYYRASDTYKVNGKGLFERYLKIFGDYFDDQVVTDIANQDTLIDIDNTPEVYLGYLWEFLGAMPYANPQPINPETWKLLFNGLDNPSTIETLKRYWLYPMNHVSNGTSDHFDLTNKQVRNLLKYSVALFSIRGTKRFFEILLKLYGLDVIVGQYNQYPPIVPVDGDDSDYYGSNDDYGGSNDDYGGSPDSLFDSLVENTKLDTEFSDLDVNCQLDKHSSCSRCVTVTFTLKPSDGWTYIADSNQFIRLYKRMYNLINLFLPLGARPHLRFEGINIDGTIGVFEPKTDRSVELCVDVPPIDLGSNTFGRATNGWYKFAPDDTSTIIKPSKFEDGRLIRLMVKVVDSGILQGLEYGEPTPKTFQINFTGLDSDWSEDLEDGHIFILPLNDKPLSFSVRPTSISPLEYNLISSDFINKVIFISEKVYQYEIFNEHSSGPYELSIPKPYTVVIIQSYAGRTSTKNADPTDDVFESLDVINFTTGLTLFPADNGDIHVDIGGTEYTISTDGLEGRHMFIDIVPQPGIYEYRQQGRPENSLKVEVVNKYNYDSKPSLILTSGTTDYVIDTDNPNTGLIKYFTNDDNFLLNIGANLYNLKTKALTILNYAIPEDYYPSKFLSILSNPPSRSISPSLLPQDEGSQLTNSFDWVCEFTDSHLEDILNDGNITDENGYIDIHTSYLTRPIHENYQNITFTLNIQDMRGYTKNCKITIHLNTGRLTISGSVSVSSRYELMSTIESLLQQDQAYLNFSSEFIKVNNYPISCRSYRVYLHKMINILKGSSIRYIGLLISVNTLYSPNPIIVDVSNPKRSYNSGENFYLSDPGQFIFKAFNTITKQYSDIQSQINVLSNKYGERYALELIDDGNTADDEEYMLRMAVPEPINGADAGMIIPYTVKVRISLNLSVIEASDILSADPEAFSFDVNVKRGTTPNNGTNIEYIDTTDFVENIWDEKDNLRSQYTVEATLNWQYVKGNYTVGTVIVNGTEVVNRPPGVYCFVMADTRKMMAGVPTYRCIDIYEQQLRGKNNLFFDVDVISRSWVKPAAQAYDYDNQGNKTWGFYKTHPDFAYSVRSCRYDPAKTEVMPQFRLNLDNNRLGYKRVMMYKLVDSNGSSIWDEGSEYTPISYKLLGDAVTVEDPELGHWLNESMGGVDDSWKAKGSERWVFTGTIYKLGELITGPQEPGKYIFRIEQLDKLVDSEPINYAYLEVKESIEYSLIIDPKVAILQGTAVITKVSAISSAKYTKEDLVVTVIGPDNQQYSEEYKPPFSFYAYQVGNYIFKLNRRESDNTLTELVTGTFKVLSDSGVSDEFLSWDWSNDSEKAVEVITTSSDVEWSVKVQDE